MENQILAKIQFFNELSNKQKYTKELIRIKNGNVQNLINFFESLSSGGNGKSLSKNNKQGKIQKNYKANNYFTKTEKCVDNESIIDKKAVNLDNKSIIGNKTVNINNRGIIGNKAVNFDNKSIIENKHVNFETIHLENECQTSVNKYLIIPIYNNKDCNINEIVGRYPDNTDNKVREEYIDHDNVKEKLSKYNKHNTEKVKEEYIDHDDIKEKLSEYKIDIDQDIIDSQILDNDSDSLEIFNCDELDVSDFDSEKIIEKREEHNSELNIDGKKNADINKKLKRVTFNLERNKILYYEDSAYSCETVRNFIEKFGSPWRSDDDE
ncbi:hypothetical protein DMUE_4710 [Dictyocoela muelleri]|nr:hypothetical protein DMUE_4710 [Dictyocoela muelleri]